MTDQLSRRLYDTLEEVGASEAVRQMHQHSASVLEFLYNISDPTVTVHFCGSRYEGSVTPDLASDVDIICLFYRHHVVLDPVIIPNEILFLMVRDDWTYPGYIKLQYVYNGRPVTECDGRREDTRYDVMGRMCREHINVDKMHGPASMIIDENGTHIQDIVLAFKCDNIPDYAQEWIFRQRNHGWPTAEQVGTMSEMGCMVVGVGHWESHERDIEWRLSFSLQERFLMSSLNPVQHKVYIVLKMIKKTILGRIIEGESLSSYHCKTTIFHAVERTPADFWIPDNLIDCILYCLRLLLQWTEEGFCPSYFIIEQNLFSKEGFMRVKDLLRSELKLLIQKKNEFVYRLDSDCISSMMRGGDMRRIRPDIDAAKYEYILGLKISVINSNNKLYYDIATMSNDLPTTIGLLQSTDSINGHSQQETQQVVNYLQPWLHLHVANGLAARAVVTDDRHSAYMLIKRADEHFCCASRTDVSSVRFAKASILYTCGKYEECKTLLQEIEQDLTSQILFMCPCTGSTFNYAKRTQYRDLIEQLSQMSVANIGTHHIASCVVFSRSESNIVPTALQYEMYRSPNTVPGPRDNNKKFWFDFAAVDARVYLYFLQYLVYEALHMCEHQQVALDNLKAEIEECNTFMARTGLSSLGHNDTAYNLLGWIYLQQTRVADAVHCFKESLRIQPVHNAAKFHLRNIDSAHIRKSASPDQHPHDSQHSS